MRVPGYFGRAALAADWNLKKGAAITSILVVTLATLSQTLSSAPASGNRYKYSTSSGVPKQANPYARLGANVSGSNSGPQGLYAALLQGQQQTRAAPSTEFQSSYNFDPILSKLSALGEMSIANARTEAAGATKQAIIDSGEAGIGQEIGADANTIEAARQNTMSTSALRQKDFGQRSTDLDESLNQRGLFYSGERIRRMQDLEAGRAMDEVNFAKQLRALLANIQDSLLASEEAEQVRQIEAMIAGAGSTTPIPGLGDVGTGGEDPLDPTGGTGLISSGDGMIDSFGGMVSPVTPPLVQPFIGGSTTENIYDRGLTSLAPAPAPAPTMFTGDPYYDEALALLLATGGMG